MVPYIVLIALPMLLQHVNLRTTSIDVLASKQKSDLAMKWFWFLLLMMLVLRHEIVGRDLPTYKYIYEYIAANDWETAINRSDEMAYGLLNKFISLFTEDFRWVMVVSALLSVWFIAKAYIKYSEDAVLSIAIYLNVSCFVLLFSGLRQSIAISLGFVAFELTRKKRFLQFLLLVAVAILFHTSAFMLLFIYPLYHIRIRRSNLVVIIPIILLVLAFNQQIFSVLGDILNSFTDYDTTIKETGAYTMLILFSIIAIFSFVIPDESKLDQDTIGMRNLLLFSVMLQTFAPLHSLAMRMNYYFIAFTPLLITRIIKNRSKSWSKVAIVARNVMVVFFITYFWLSAPRDNLLDTFPYHFFWEKTI